MSTAAVLYSSLRDETCLVSYRRFSLDRRRSCILNRVASQTCTSLVSPMHSWVAFSLDSSIYQLGAKPAVLRAAPTRVKSMFRALCFCVTVYPIRLRFVDDQWALAGRCSTGFLPWLREE